MADKISPEEKLFNVIRDGKKGGAKPMSPPHGIKKFFKFIRKPARAQAAISGAPSAFSINFNEIKPRTVNTALTIILAGLVALVIYVAVNEKPRLAAITGTVSGAPAGQTEAGAIEAFRPMSFYLAEVKKRDIFQPISEAEPEEQKPDPQEAALSKLAGIAADFKLQGISWGRSPKAMVKCENEDKMYFLGKEQPIGSTGVRIKDIYKNKVIISYEGAEMELL